MTEENKYKIIKKLVESGGNKQRAGLKLGCTVRHINRLIEGYTEHGKAYFVHGNRTKKPVTVLDEKTKDLIIELYTTKYVGSNFTHFQELLLKKEAIKVSRCTISTLLREHHVLSPKAHRSTKRTLKKELEALQITTKSKEEVKKNQSSILDFCEAHPRKSRCCYFGELLQMDASVHRWLPNQICHLHVAIDDATGAILGAFFDEQETLRGYYNVLHQILTTHGIPYQFLTDNRTVFEYKKLNSKDLEKDTFTQFGYACKQLGIELKTTSIPQAKGRVERVFNTLQSRLPIELRLANINSIEDAAPFLKTYIQRFNKQFSIVSNSIKSVFDNQVDAQKVNLILAVIDSRKIDNGSALKYHNEYYLPADKNGKSVLFRKGTLATVIKSFDERLFCCIDDNVYALEKIPLHQKSSKNFDFTDEITKPKKKYIPPMDHPWRQYSIKNHFNSP